MGIRKISEGLAVAFIRKQLASGKTIEIPSLGIVIEPNQYDNKMYKLAEQFEQERHYLTSNEEASFLDEEYLNWLQDN